MDKRKLTILMGILSVVLLAACVFTYLGKDRKGPEIVFAGDSVSWQQGDDTSVLLEDVSASDERDGDVTESVKIDQITEIQSMNYIVVTYVAKDNSNNITKKARWIDLTSGSTVDEPLTGLEVGLEEEAGNTDAGQQEETETPETEEETEKETEEEAENPETEESETEEELPLVSTGAPIIQITEHDITLAIGEQFDCMSYVRTCIDDVDTMDELYSRIVVNGEDKDGNYVGAGMIDTSRANTYHLQYYVVDTDGNMSNIEKMMVTVGE